MHRTEVTEVTEGDGDLVRKLFGERREFLGGNHANGGKHRTEVTEVTEGDGDRGENFSVNAGNFWAGITRKGECIAQRSQRGEWRFG
jgi:hypothetical protein